MAKIDQDTQTAFANVDWQEYLQSRPPYPPSLRDIILSYRREHNATVRHERILDIGGGVGVSCAQFAADFDVLHLSDPSPHNLAKGEVYLAEWIHHHQLPTRTEITQCRAEDIMEKVPAASADLVICAEAAHFIDSEVLTSAMAHALRPGGTMAVYSYWIPNFPLQAPRFYQVCSKTFWRVLGFCMEAGGPQAEVVFARAAARVTCGRGLLDSIAVPAIEYRDVRRVRINSQSENGAAAAAQYMKVRLESIPSQVEDSEEEKFYETGKDAEAEGWSFLTDTTWMRRFLRTMMPPDFELTAEQSRDLFGEMDELFAADCPSGKAEVFWPVNVVLATRR